MLDSTGSVQKKLIDRRLKYLVVSWLIISPLAMNLSCNSGGGSENGSGSTAVVAASFPAKPSMLRINLTDAPNPDLKEVHVNVNHVELLLSASGENSASTKRRLILAQDFGDVDLLKLQNGVSLPLADVKIPAQVQVHEIRLVLNANDGTSINYAVKGDDSICSLQTPSGQQSGIKIKLATPVIFEEGQIYSMTLDFDAAKSVVVKGNGECLLKPVLRLPSFVKVPAAIASDGGGASTDPGQEQALVDGSDSNTSSDNGSTDAGDAGTTTPESTDPMAGWDPYDPTSLPPDLTPEELDAYYSRYF